MAAQRKGDDRHLDSCEPASGPVRAGAIDPAGVPERTRGRVYEQLGEIIYAVIGAESRGDDRRHIPRLATTNRDRKVAILGVEENSGSK
jgi:hypothetical protein